MKEVLTMEQALRVEIRKAWEERAVMNGLCHLMEQLCGEEFADNDKALNKLGEDFNDANVRYEMARFNIRQLKHVLGGGI